MSWNFTTLQLLIILQKSSSFTTHFYIIFHKLVQNLENYEFWN